MQTNGTFGDIQPRNTTNANVPDSVVISATSLNRCHNKARLNRKQRPKVFDTFSNYNEELFTRCSPGIQIRKW
ncbi:hypothetical protein DPMN_138094 [Dreissena polymorpha]|uniref:Uncharacterized protein n=1 Tax=Dreissena polymorpha TaxID=45954 RepID=A0A9D4JI95_DREPO|nr:hypothetical protein DPMN_138094 [Dreissena polymorpha]